MKKLLTITLLLGVAMLSTVNGQQSMSSSNTYAVVVGISDYQDEAIPDLRFADKDALAFAGFLQSPAGGALDEDHLKVLINEQATVAQFAIALDWLWEVVKEDDRVIIYFSGHGDVERKSITQPGYLLCWDAPSRVYLAGGALALPMFQDVITTLSAQNKAKVVVITDACRSGKLSGSSVGGAQITGSNLAKQYANEIKILSCQPEEYSIEGEQWGGGRGAFSYHLLDGLTGMADGNEDYTVNLKEIGRYLEDNVTEEVAPQNQNPMVVGNKTEKLVDVFPELLEQLKEGKIEQLQLFTATESRGIEDEVLAAADSNIVEMYLAFQKTIEEKEFLEPGDACADFYFNILSQEPQLQKLHSSMRRNYAAALQDDAQQVMNTMLKSGLTKIVLKAERSSFIYKNYPAYLERAIELLGEDHYMYEVLQARKLYFEALITKEKEQKIILYKKALEWQPEMPHAYLRIMASSDASDMDTVIHYFQKTIKQVPTWVLPYLVMSEFYERKLNQKDKAEEYLNLAEQIDSTSVIVWYMKGNFHLKQNQYELAEKWYMKVLEASENEICFPCLHLQLASIDKANLRTDEAMDHVKKALELDSTFLKGYTELGTYYLEMNKFEEAERLYKKAIEIDSMHFSSLGRLADFYSRTRQGEKMKLVLDRMLEIDSTHSFTQYHLSIYHINNGNNVEAAKILNKMIKRDSLNGPAHVNLGLVYVKMEQFEAAENIYRKALSLNRPRIHPYAYSGLGEVYLNAKEWDKAIIHFKKAIELNPNLTAAYFNLSFVYIENGNFIEAEKTLIAALEKDPKNIHSHIFFCYLKLKTNQLNEAWYYLEKGIELGTDYESLQSDDKLEAMRQDPKWDTTMRKYFPEKYEKSK